MRRCRRANIDAGHNVIEPNISVREFSRTDSSVNTALLPYVSGYLLKLQKWLELIENLVRIAEELISNDCHPKTLFSALLENLHTVYCHT